MGSDDDWKLVPNHGLGQLTFGVTKAIVEALRNTYGDLVREMSDRILDSSLQDTIAQFGDGLSSQEKEQLFAIDAQSGPDATSTTQVRGEHGLVLRFESDRMVELTLSLTHEDARLERLKIFRDPARDVLAQAERMNGEPGLYRDATAIFQTLNLTFEGFSLAETRNVRDLDKGDGRYRSRTVGVFEALDLSIGMEGYRSFSWLPA